MTVWIALLRGINVGKAKRVAMAELRALFEELGYKDVKTLLNSGNVVFSGGAASPASIEVKVEAAFTARFGFSSRITVLTAAELEHAVRENSNAAVEDPSRYFVAFLKTAADREMIAPLSGENWHPEVFALGTRAAYMWCPGGALDSPLSTRVNKALKDGVTVRNWATVLKLAALAKPAA
jgi:uncharacterized protein (DUF1697 family)